MLAILLTAIMTPKEELVTVQEGTGLEEIKTKLYEHRIEKMLVVNEKFQLRGMGQRSAISKKLKRNPFASKDDQGRLRVGAAVGTGASTASA